MQGKSSIFKGKVFFQADFCGTEFDLIEFSSPLEGVAKATIRASHSEGALLEVEISNADTLKVAMDKAKEVAKYLARVITFEFSIFQQEFRCTSDHLIEDEPSTDGSAQEIKSRLGLGFGVTSESWITLGKQQMDSLKDSLEKNNHDSFPSYDLFYSALGLTDPIARFMVLYLIVLSLCKEGAKERQEDVDRFVLSIEPQVLTFPPFNPRRSGVQETIYTKLRNQVGHIQPGTTIQSTREEMEKSLDELIKITREIISRQP